MPCCHAPHSDRQIKRRVQPRSWKMRRSPQHCGMLLQLYFLQLYLCVSCISDSQNTMTKSKRRTLYQPHVCTYYSTVLPIYPRSSAWASSWPIATQEHSRRLAISPLWQHPFRCLCLYGQWAMSYILTLILHTPLLRNKNNLHRPHQYA